MPARQAGGGGLRRVGASVHGPHRAFAQRTGRGAEQSPWPVAHGRVLESGTVIMEVKDGPYVSDDDVHHIVETIRSEKGSGGGPMLPGRILLFFIWISGN